MGASAKEIAAALEAPEEPRSLDAPIGDEDDRTLLDLQASDEPSPLEGVLVRERLAEVQTQVKPAELAAPRMRALGLERPEIGSALGVSRSKVGQMIGLAMASIENRDRRTQRGATRGRKRRTVPSPHHHGGRGDVGMQALLGLLQLEGFTDARLVGDEIQVTAHGEPLTVRACADGYEIYRDGYEIYRASGAGVTGICRDAREVMMQVRGVRSRRSSLPSRTR